MADWFMQVDSETLLPPDPTVDALTEVIGDAVAADLAPIASPTFTGTVTVPTPAVTGAAATKGYVDGLSTRPSSDRTVYVSTSGTDANNGRALGLPFLTIGAALAALGTSPGTVQVAGGTYSFSATLNRYSGQRIIGAGSNNTILSYTGAGTAIGSAVAGNRIYGCGLDGFTLTTSTGAIGIDLDSVSISSFRDVFVSAFSSKGWNLRSTTAGGCVYNSFFNCRAAGAGTATASIGWAVEAVGSNTNNWFSCAAINCGLGLSIADANQNVWFGGTFEINGVGFKVVSTTNALSDLNVVRGARFEGNTQNWLIDSSFVRGTELDGVAEITAVGSGVDNGVRTQIRTVNGLNKAISATAADAAGSWRWERTANGGSELPAVVISDSATASGTPVSLQIQTERSTGYPFRATRGGTNYFDIDAAGNVRQPQGSYFELTERADPASPSANSVRLYAKDNGSGATQIVARFATGGAQVILTDGVTSSGGGNPGHWVAADNGLIACDADPLLSSSTVLLPTAGVVFLRKMKMAATSVITNVLLYVSTAGASLSNAYVAVFDAAGAQLGVSADQSTAWQSTGIKTIALGSPTASQSGGTWVYVAILVGAGSPLPTLRAFPASIHTLGMSAAATYRWATTGTGLTAMPSSFTPAGVASAGGGIPLVGLS